MSDSPKYFIAQYIPDAFRREPRNVGVIVQKGDAIHARFFGERGAGDIDGRSVKWMPHPEVYRQWVKYWRSVIERKSEKLERTLMRANGDNYNILDAGFVTGTAVDSAETVCCYLYSLLVSEGGLIEALGSKADSDESLANLKTEVTSAFRACDIVGQAGGLFPPHPILVDTFLAGETETHQPSYVQNNGDLWVMEPVNFITAKKSAAKDHAGWALAMFDDIAKKHKGVKPVGIIRATHQELAEDRTVQYAVNLLKSGCTIVNWTHEQDRNRFIFERTAIAMGRAG